ncbi:MAG TPA: hypothetical protein PKE00_12930 [Planctomycetota bacterium]|nr:hypothetical protein [Planctomycetota bacterium]
MDVIPLLVFCSLGLAGIGVLLFITSTKNQDHEHADRLALLPLEDDLPPSRSATDFGRTQAAHARDALGSLEATDTASNCNTTRKNTEAR